MDKYEYKLKSEQIKKLYEESDFKTLLNIADSFDWRKITSNVLLNIVSDAYEQVGKIEKAYDLLLMAYDRTSFGRNLAYRLSLLALKLGKTPEAIDFYTDFVRKAPKDPNQFILKYEILKAKNAETQDLIKALEAYLLLDIDEKWEFELAMLYHQSGLEDKCIERCNRLTLWFSDSEYVKNALDLKKMYTPLTAKQEEKYVKAVNSEKVRAVNSEEVNSEKLSAINDEDYISNQELFNEEYEEIRNDAPLIDEEVQNLFDEGYETFHYEPDEQEMLMEVVKSISEFNDSELGAVNSEEVKSEELSVVNSEEVNSEELDNEELNDDFSVYAELDDDDSAYDDSDMEELNAVNSEDLNAVNSEVVNSEKLDDEELNDDFSLFAEFDDEEFKTEDSVVEEFEDKQADDEVPEEQVLEDQDLEDEEIDDQIDGQMTLESLLEVHQILEDEAQKKLEEVEKKLEEERLERATFIAEKARLLREEIERQNDLELDGPFGDIFAKEFAESDEELEAMNNEELIDEEQDDEQEEESYCLTPELRVLFERYLPINKMEEQLAETLDNLINFYEEDGTSSANNIVIMGDEKSGKTSLIIDIIKVINCKRNRNGRKVAKIKGESLNRKGMEVTMPKLFGADLIIERAGNLNPETVQGIIKAMKDYTEDMIVILEDSEVALERLFKVNDELVEMFGNVIKIKEIGVKEWVEIAKEYARKRGYIVDEMGTLALHVKIGNVYSRELKLEADDIECVIDDAIEKAKRKKRYAKKHRIEGFAVLREVDFM